MKPDKLTRKSVTANAFETESKVKIGNKVYILKRHFLGKRELTEAINKIIINEAVR